jgi:serine/threonine protein kinase
LLTFLFFYFFLAKRYDAKADLWSVGTVLFEMIAGRPPFNGENHIDLLRNIQRKAVRLPPDVRVSKACVNLLRLLLNRNPLSRAGFKDFFEACDVFVALGCEGVGTNDSGTCRIATSDLGTIPENDGSSSPGSNSLITVATTSHPHQQEQQVAPQYGIPQTMQTQTTKPARIVSPALAPTPAPAAMISQTSLGSQQALARQYPNRLAPLTQSPPNSAQTFLPGAAMPAGQSLGSQAMQPWQQQTTYAAELVPSNRRPELNQSQASGDESEFVMVEHGANSRNDFYDQTGVPNWMVQPTGAPNTGGPYYVNAPHSNADKTNTGGFRRSGSKGMLSTSPGTGRLLMGLVARTRLGQ